jgi:hypothetical protein
MMKAWASAVGSYLLKEENKSKPVKDMSLHYILGGILSLKFASKKDMEMYRYIKICVFCM